jgi:hypothetical protein
MEFSYVMVEGGILLRREYAPRISIGSSGRCVVASRRPFDAS